MFIPQKCLAGFNRREETYSKKLAYVIYWDEKGKLRKEGSWRSWIESKEGELEFDNVPRTGFVLNRKVGGYATGWNHRSTKVRVYDPLGFEMELSVENLLYILEHTSCIQGKGLEGEFMYAWSGTDLWLIPCNDPGVAKWREMADKMFNPQKINARSLNLGHTYLTKGGSRYIYLGKRMTTEGKMKHIFSREHSLAGYVINPKMSDFVEDLGDYALSSVHKYEPIFDYAPELNKITKVEQIVITPEQIVKAYELGNMPYNQRVEEINGVGYKHFKYYHTREGSFGSNSWNRSNSIDEWMCSQYGKTRSWYREKSLPDNFVPTLEQAKEVIQAIKPAINHEFIYENGKSHSRINIGSGYPSHSYNDTLKNLSKGVNWNE